MLANSKTNLQSLQGKVSVSPTTVERQYLPAVLKHNKKGWIIEYQALHPQTMVFERKRIKLNRERKRFTRQTDFKLYAYSIVCNINNRLAGGWSPFMVNENSRYYTPLSTVIAAYIDEKERELRPSTLVSYKSFCRMFSTWAEKNTPQIYMSLFNRVLAIQYLDYVYKERKVTAKTWNNQLKMGRAFFSWAKEKCYVKENPFELIKTKREDPKKRILIPKEARDKITAYFEEKKPNYIVVCQLVFNTLIRPNEIANIQLKHISMKDKTIYIPSENAKNHHARYAAMTPQLIERLEKMHLERYPLDYYLFGVGYAPAPEAISTKTLRKDWLKMRQALHLPEEMQLYSLRDTGINNLLKCGIDPLSVMQHADHHDLQMTTRYANHADPNLTKLIYENAPEF